MAVNQFNNFKQIGDTLHQALVVLVAKTAIDGKAGVQAKIRENGQIDTAAMINSVAVQDGENELTKYVTVGPEYAIYQNYGSKFMPGRPFMEPGMAAPFAGFEAGLAAIESKLR